jgi:tubulin monoglycylase TTLL3/8
MAYRSAALVPAPSTPKNKELNERVRKAKQDKKVFTLTGGYESIRQGLLSRGWLEKVTDDKLPFIPAPESERLSIALLLKNVPYNFIWQPRLRPYKINEQVKPYVNSVVRNGMTNYTNKDGIVHCMRNFHWNYIEGVTDLNVQRTHILADRPTKEEFVEDFRRTAFTSFILYLDSLHDMASLFYPNGDVSSECIRFALQKIEMMLKVENHEDIDTTRIFDVCAKYPKDQRRHLKDIQLILNGGKKFRAANLEVILRYKDDVKECAAKILTTWPYTKYDGYKNIWIFKPVGWSSGSGIQVTNKESEINDIIMGKSGACIRFVAQKYIERPLLIFNRKFDMRLYLLTMIRDGHIDIWLYKDCYVKFATNLFNLNYFNKSIHVTNYAVQKYFMNPKDAVPDARENMWSLQQLIEYFASTGKPKLWQSHIYPAIKKNLLSVIIPSFEITELSENNFELNGVDVMVR